MFPWDSIPRLLGHDPTPRPTCPVNVEVLVKERHLVERQFLIDVVRMCICCVGFASLDVVCDELNKCAWNLGL